MRLPLLVLTLFVPLASASLSAEGARDYFAEAGLGKIQEGEVRFWNSQVMCSGGVSLTGVELIEYRPCYRLPSQYEVRNGLQWIKSRLSAENAQEIRDALAHVVDLNGRQLDCGQVLDGETVVIEARVNGVHVLLKAQSPDEHTGDACRRVSILRSLLLNAARSRSA